MAQNKGGVFGRVFGVVGLIFGFFFLIGSIFVVVAWFVWGSAQEFARDGVVVMGRVEKRWESTRECKDSNSTVTRTCTDFNVGYSYEVGAKRLHGSGTTGYDTYAGLEEGAPIKLRYLASDPGNVATSFSAETVDASGGMGVVALIFGLLGGIFALIGGGGVGWLIRRWMLAERVRKTGTARGAVVVAQEETGVTVNDRRMWRILWKDDAGGMGQSRGRGREDLPVAGARITIYADPSGRLEPVWEGDVGAR